RFKTSSKHLILASKYFERRLSNRWPEGDILESRGTVQLELPDTDLDAFKIILDLIHGRTNAVPRTVDLAQLTELTVLTDYFGCLEALGLFPSSWINGLKDDIPTTYCRDLMKWIFISCVFEQKEILSGVTQVAQRQSKDVLDPLDLPIPQNIQDRINDTRIEALSGIFKALNDRREELENKTICSFECDSSKLGD
ncbi:hypothetical protein ASPWEDRAFT_117243, partial [Aspergillus wentii DTO 134E9]